MFRRYIDKKILALGMDLGSRFIKFAVVVETDVGIHIDLFRKDTVEFYRNNIIAGNDSFKIDFHSLGIPEGTMIYATGYGRETANILDATIISEIIAHAYGILLQTELTDFVIIDMGGQDSKVIEVKNKMIVDFNANDRCAASTGRYLENMAHILGMTLDEISKHYKNPSKLSSVCAVFGETELLSRISRGESVEHLAAGVNHALIERFYGILNKKDLKHVVLTGGVSTSYAIQRIIEDTLATDIVIPPFPQYNGALGCLHKIIDHSDITDSTSIVP